MLKLCGLMFCKNPNLIASISALFKNQAPILSGLDAQWQSLNRWAVRGCYRGCLAGLCLKLASPAPLLPLFCVENEQGNLFKTELAACRITLLYQRVSGVFCTFYKIKLLSSSCPHLLHLSGSSQIHLSLTCFSPITPSYFTVSYLVSLTGVCVCVSFFSVSWRLIYTPNFPFPN